MDNCRAILKRVGLVLIIVGVFDVGIMIFCILNRVNYSSSLNIFSIIAGILILRGNLGAVRVVAFFSAFLITGSVGAMLLLPFLQPLDLSIVEFQKNSLMITVSTALAFMFIFVLVWVYKQLRSPAVISARVAAGHSSSPPKLAFMFGAAIVIGLVIMIKVMTGGEVGSKAIELARTQVGSGYKFYISGMRRTGDRVSASVTAYNANEIKLIEVSWQR